MTIKTQFAESNGTYLFRFPYELKDAFRTIFKTAQWDPIAKAFVVKATKANLTKWEAFVEQANTIAPELDGADKAEATKAELDKLASELLFSKTRLEQRVAVLNDSSESMRKQIDLSKAAIAALGPVLESAELRARAVQEEASAAQELLLHATAPARDVFDRHEVEAVLDKMFRAASRGYPGKETLNETQAQLITCCAELNEVGYANRYLTEICDFSTNRPDKFKEAVPRAKAALLTGLRPA